MKMLSRSDGFMLCDKLAFDFSTFERVYSINKIRLQLIRAGPNLYIISDNPNVVFGTVDCTLYTRSVVFKNDHHKQKKGHACINSCGAQLFGDSSKEFFHSC